MGVVGSVQGMLEHARGQQHREQAVLAHSCAPFHEQSAGMHLSMLEASNTESKQC